MQENTGKPINPAAAARDGTHVGRRFQGLEALGVRIHHLDVGNYFTSLEMAGVTLTLMRLDAQLNMGLTQFG